MKLGLLYESDSNIIGYHRLPSFWMIRQIEENGFEPIMDRICFSRSLEDSKEWDFMGDYFIKLKISSTGDKDYFKSYECAVYDLSKIRFIGWGIDLGIKVIEFPWNTTRSFNWKLYDQIVKNSNAQYGWNQDFNSGKLPEEIIDMWHRQRQEWYE